MFFNILTYKLLTSLTEKNGNNGNNYKNTSVAKHDLND